MDVDEETVITVPLGPRDVSDAEKIKEVIRLLELAVEECARLLKDAGEH